MTHKNAGTSYLVRSINHYKLRSTNLYELAPRSTLMISYVICSSRRGRYRARITYEVGGTRSIVATFCVASVYDTSDCVYMPAQRALSRTVGAPMSNANWRAAKQQLSLYALSRSVLLRLQFEYWYIL